MTPLGVGGERLHDWLVATRTFKQMIGEKGGGEGVDDRFAAAGSVPASARRSWAATCSDRSAAPGRTRSGRAGGATTRPTTHDVFVLTRYPRSSFDMEGGTSFHFVTDGIGNALDRAVVAAKGQDVLIAGGASTIQQYLAGRADRRAAPRHRAGPARRWRTAVRPAR